jgi:hypothetical protein
MNIDKLNIITLDMYDEDAQPSSTTVDSVNYVEMGYETFKKIITNPEFKFLEYNKDTLYILRDGSYTDVKKLFSSISGFDVNLGRGGSQKSHIISPLDFRMSFYLMALFNFDYKYIAYLNTFNDLPKDRYLPFIEKTVKIKTIVNSANTLSRKYPNRINNTFVKPSSNREYHTNSITKENLSDEKTIDSSVFSYLDDIEEIIKRSTSLYEAQKEIETS